ncbi:VOC family protein [Zavarzinia compransoris]|uniref:Glyoxalase n=1 Tax=Zavarzinia compransoris TaxID=1264899 RepID=A0A317E1R0_9PROT|nr:VOC family protein [Zavarzinia compransoris]PWR21027.1 glyoxalase [Zavarzinia compransoris]TDP44059.1 hypothetical protein DES42_108106 [Zavarzinia compransoris]
MAGIHGQFVWYELMTDNLEGALAFYRAVTGWTVAAAGAGGVDYRVLSAGAAMVAGAMAIPDEDGAAGMRPGWTVYVGAGNTDETAAAIAAAGGKVLREPADIPEVGRFAIVADAQGAPFGIIAWSEPGEAPGVDIAPGRIGWHELFAGDEPTIFPFYEQVFGWSKAEGMDMGPMGTYQLFRTRPGEAVGGIMTRTPEIPHPFWNFYIAVDDIDAALARVTANGGTVVQQPMEVPGGVWIIQAVDPQGAFFSLVGPRA